MPHGRGAVRARHGDADSRAAAPRRRRPAGAGGPPLASRPVLSRVLLRRAGGTVRGRIRPGPQHSCGRTRTHSAQRVLPARDAQRRAGRLRRAQVLR